MKLLLVDDHPMVRDGLVLLIAEEFAQLQVIQAGTLSEALKACAQHPDIGAVFLDLHLPDAHGLSGLLALRTAVEGLKVVVLSADDALATVMAALDAGAAGYIPKTSPSTLVLAALRHVLAGGVYLPACAVGPLRQDRRLPDAASLGLSPRQTVVLRLLIEGKPNKQICRDLGLAEATVKTHLAAIFQRLNVSSRTQAVIAAARLGFQLPVSEL